MNTLLPLLMLFLFSCKVHQKSESKDFYKTAVSVDSDGDLISDYEEIQNKTDPQIANLAYELKSKVSLVLRRQNKIVDYASNFDLKDVFRKKMIHAIRQEFDTHQAADDLSFPAFPLSRKDFPRMNELWFELNDLPLKFDESIELNQKKISSEEISQIENDQFILNLASDPSAKIQSIKKRCYRVLVSTQDKFQYFFVSMNLPFSNFLSQKMKLNLAKGLSTSPKLIELFSSSTKNYTGKSGFYLYVPSGSSLEESNAESTYLIIELTKEELTQIDLTQRDQIIALERGQTAPLSFSKNKFSNIIIDVHLNAPWVFESKVSESYDHSKGQPYLALFDSKQMSQYLDYLEFYDSKEWKRISTSDKAELKFSHFSPGDIHYQYELLLPFEEASFRLKNTEADDLMMLGSGISAIGRKYVLKYSTFPINISFKYLK